MWPNRKGFCPPNGHLKTKTGPTSKTLIIIYLKNTYMVDSHREQLYTFSHTTIRNHSTSQTSGVGVRKKVIRKIFGNRRMEKIMECRPSAFVLSN
jgi:hypothetical protein